MPSGEEADSSMSMFDELCRRRPVNEEFVLDCRYRNGIGGYGFSGFVQVMELFEVSNSCASHWGRSQRDA